MIIFQDWLVRNSQRKYPVDENASLIDDAGVPFPEGFLVDANIWVPKYSYGTKELRFLYISSASSTDSLVSLTLLGATDPIKPAVGEDAQVGPEPEFVPIAVLTVPKPVELYKNYAISPLLKGVSGWVAFGQGVDKQLNSSFLNPEQSMLAPKSCRYYDNLPVRLFTTEQGFSNAVGDVIIVASDPMVATVKTMLVNEIPKRAMVLELTRDAAVLSDYAGPCGGKPESGSCNHTAITSISGVVPDCDGNIQVIFDGVTVRYFDHGMCIDSPISLADVCGQTSGLPDENGVLPGEVVWTRPCDLTTPYVADLGDVAVLDELVLDGGAAYWDPVDEKIIMGAAGYPSGSLAPCLQTVPLDGSVEFRTHHIEFAVENGSMPGVSLLENLQTRIVVENSYDDEGVGTARVFKYKKFLHEEGDVLAADLPASGDISVSIYPSGRIVVDLGGVEALDYTFEPSDPYWDPNGKVGAYIGGPFSTNVALTGYSVTDV